MLSTAKSSTARNFRMVIEDETDFIHKVRNKFHRKRNHLAAIKVQAFARGVVVRRWYRPMRDMIVNAVTKIQNFLRMTWVRCHFKQYIRDLKYNSATTIQKFTKGFLAHKEWKDKMHKAIIDNLLEQFQHMKLKLQTDAQIRIGFAWRSYKRRKALRKAIKKKAKEGKAKKKAKKTVGGVASTLVRQVAQAMEQQPPKGKKTSPKASPKLSQTQV